MKTNAKKGLFTLLPLSVLALFALGSPVHATSPCTPTACNLHGISVDFGPLGPNPCTGVGGVGDLTATGNLQSHSAADGSHSTFTFTGSGTITETNGVTGEIRVVTWDGGNVNSNNQQVEFTAIFEFTAHLSDGSFVGLHSNGQITVNADGTVTANFNFNHMTCG